MKQITKDFTYDIPDEYLAQTKANGDTATASYTGPAKLWVFVQEQTGKNTSDAMQLDENWDGNPDLPAPEGQVKVELDCEGADTLICAIFLPHSVSVKNVTDVVTDLPEDYGKYSNPWPPPPEHAYEREMLVYKPDTADIADTAGKEHTGGDWELTFKQPWMTWGTMTQLRNDLLAMSDGKVSFDQPDSVKQPWIDWRQKMRDLPTVWKRGEAGEFPAHMVKFPAEPTRGGFADPPPAGTDSDPTQVNESDPS